MLDADTRQVLWRRYGADPRKGLVEVSLPRQTLTWYDASGGQKQWPVSTAERGAGCTQDSNCTPTGIHRVAQKIGAGAVCGSVFRARQLTGEVIEPIQATVRLEQDYITSRILWLEGLEPGINQGPGQDSHERYIYIHGTAEEGLIGQAVSHGCIRMKNADVIELFELVSEGTLVILRA